MTRLVRPAIAMLTAAAIALIVSHLRMPGQTAVGCMEHPAAALGSSERMQTTSAAGWLDINRATLDELDRLPGIGPAIAQRIIDEREAGGPFHYPEDLLCVRGIGEKTLEKLRGQICIP